MHELVVIYLLTGCRIRPGGRYKRGRAAAGMLGWYGQIYIPPFKGVAARGRMPLPKQVATFRSKQPKFMLGQKDQEVPTAPHFNMPLPRPRSDPK